MNEEIEDIMLSLDSDIQDLEEWSAYHNDWYLSEIEEIKRNIMALQKKIENE